MTLHLRRSTNWLFLHYITLHYITPSLCRRRSLSLTVRHLAPSENILGLIYLSCHFTARNTSLLCILSINANSVLNKSSTILSESAYCCIFDEVVLLYIKNVGLSIELNPECLQISLISMSNSVYVKCTVGYTEMRRKYSLRGTKTHWRLLNAFLAQ